jgi:hypothetical protein
MDPKDYELAKKRVLKKKKFYNHLITFVIINVVMSILVALDGNPFDFFPATLLWGMGLAFHYVRVFGIPGVNILSPEWEDEELRKELEKMNGGRPPQLEEPKEPEEGEKLDLKELRKNYDDRDLV